uniref:Transposase n=1 Tax=Angiostrongylus cantonensis TaxID=6313 RepID=A0A0K0DI36_ANGCA
MPEDVQHVFEQTRCQSQISSKFNQSLSVGLTY